MSIETRRTLVFMTIAIGLVLAAWATQPGAPSGAPDAEAEPFFPEFSDPNAATSLEVVEFDETTSSPRPFKVANRDGRWTIPSHADYPADGATSLSSIAAALVSLRRGEVISDLPADHERLGVVDPLDEGLAVVAGRGTRITVRGRNDVILADIIAGHALQGRPALRYLRVPGERRVYAASVGDVEISTRFEDWIERHLLLVDRDDIDQIVVRNYAADLDTGAVTERDRLALRTTADGQWTADGLSDGETIDTFTMNLLVTRLIELELASVLPKPPGVVERLSQPSGGALVADDVA